MREIGSFTSPAAWQRFSLAYEQALSLCPPPADRHDLDTVFGSTRVYRFGDSAGVPIVLIHGRGATAAMWASNLPGLSASRTVYAVDVLGEPGRSVQAAPIRGATDTASWLTEVLARLDLPAAHLVGMSNGGWVALNQAIRADGRVLTVSLIDPAGGIGRYPTRFRLASALTGAMPPAVRSRYLRWAAGSPDAADPRMRLLATGANGYRIRSETPSYFSDDALRSVRVPALLLLGGRSVVNAPNRVLARARRLIPGVDADIVVGGTHALPYDFPDLVNGRVLSFINRNEPAEPAEPA